MGGGGGGGGGVHVYQRASTRKAGPENQITNYYTLRAADPFTTKFDGTHKPECPVKRLDCCVTEGHNDESKLHWLFVSSVFSVPLIFLQPNLCVWMCCYS